MVIVVGNLSWDLIVKVKTFPAVDTDVKVMERVEVAGGAGANVAVWVARSGCACALTACVGNDRAGRDLVREIGRHGVITRLVRRVAAPTAQFIVVVDGRGRRNFFLCESDAAFQCNQSLPSDEVLAVADAIAFVGCSTAVAERVLRAVPSGRAPVFAAAGFWVSGGRGRIPGSISSRCTAMFMNASEFQRSRGDFVGGRRDGGGPLVIVTKKTGSAVWRGGRRVLSVRSRPISRIQNTIGCGDAFMGGFVAGFLHGKSVAECCRRGHQLAGRVARLVTER